MRSRVAKTLGLVVAMVACVGMTVFAAPSPSATTVVNKVSKAVDKDGNAVEVTIKDVPAEYADAVAEVKTEAKLKELLGSEFTATTAVASVREISVPEGTKFPVTITFEMNGVTSSSKVWVLHYDTEKGAWEKVEATAGEGTISATFTSLSPVAFVVDKATLSSGAGTTSPKTSASAVSAVAVLGLAAVAGVCGLKKKSYAK